ncbi:hypothetical protein PR048_008946 [Dryococelus australis]|uniref:Uncharacterized protein n=1 Tax=Dryococelus australis TaxID=614101 RepID=A0ABQ9HYW6_9NEOP|nr:hypothetical protein PR048_008946 [Dryococelus australis]
MWANTYHLCQQLPNCYRLVVCYLECSLESLRGRVEVCIERHWNLRAGKTRGPRESLLTSGIVRHDSHKFKNVTEHPRQESAVCEEAMDDTMHVAMLPLSQPCFRAPVPPHPAGSIPVCAIRLRQSYVWMRGTDLSLRTTWGMDEVRRDVDGASVEEGQGRKPKIPQKATSPQPTPRVGTSVVRLLPSHQGDRGTIPGRVSPDFCMWESCRTMPLVGKFSRGSPVSSTLSFQHYSILTSITLIGSQDLDIKSRPYLFTQTIIEKGSPLQCMLWQVLGGRTGQVKVASTIDSLRATCLYNKLWLTHCRQTIKSTPWPPRLE